MTVSMPTLKPPPTHDSAALAERLERVRERIRAAEERYDRPVGSVELLAVSKRHSVSAIEAIHDAGQRRFGENYVDEALEKQAALADRKLEWHFIGPIQSNKTRAIAEHFAWVHSADRLKILRRLSDQRPADRKPLSVLLQVKLGDEATKAGATPETIEALADAAIELPGLSLRGLMCIPPPEATIEAQRRWFRELRELYAALGAHERGWDTLSMGMSGDLEAAVAEGTTMVRIGTDIFGPRG